MNIYLVKRTTSFDYDEYDSFVVCAEDITEARKTHPFEEDSEVTEEPKAQIGWGSWVPFSQTEATMIGKALKGFKNRQVICASFNAG